MYFPADQAANDRGFALYQLFLLYTRPGVLASLEVSRVHVIKSVDAILISVLLLYCFILLKLVKNRMAELRSESVPPLDVVNLVEISETIPSNVVEVQIGSDADSQVQSTAEQNQLTELQPMQIQIQTQQQQQQREQQQTVGATTSPAGVVAASTSAGATATASNGVGSAAAADAIQSDDAVPGCSCDNPSTPSSSTNLTPNNELRKSFLERREIFAKAEKYAEKKCQTMFNDFSQEIQNALRFTDIMFNDRMLNEYNRLRTFMHAPQKLQDIARDKRFTHLGLYYSGKNFIQVLRSSTRCNIKKEIECYYVSCAFCDFEGVFTSEDLEVGNEKKFELAWNRILINHLFHTSRQPNCSEKKGNKPLNDQLSLFNLHMTHSSNLYPMTQLEPISKRITLTRVEVENRDNVRVVCQMCKQRIIDVALFPCGYIFMCGVCAASYTCENCVNCDKSIVGYGRAILI